MTKWLLFLLKASFPITLPPFRFFKPLAHKPDIYVAALFEAHGRNVQYGRSNSGAHAELPSNHIAAPMT